MKLRIILLTLLPLLFAVSNAAADDCTDCLARKKEMCAKECRLVTPEFALKCQEDCIQQYCLHRCPVNHPAITQTLKQSCNDCLDQQFNLCTPNCPHGTDRIRAMCKLGCAKQRCTASCENS